MKKYILLLLLATFGTQAQTYQNPTYGKLKLKTNTESTTATKVNVQENDGTINTKPLSEIYNYLEFASAVNLPVTGEQGKLYLTKDNNRLYRFNGTVYQELTTDISGKEDIANKQNSLAVDGTNTKYPTVTAVNTGLALKANLASPALTGTPTAPTATAGTNTTQIATTAFVLANRNANGLLGFNTTDRTVWNNGKGNISSNTIFGELALKSNTTGSNNTSLGQSTLKDNTIGVSNTAIGAGALGLNTTGSKNVAIGSGAGQNVGHTIVNNSVFLGDGCKPLADNQTNQIVIGENATGSGSNTATLGNTSITTTILRGTVTTNGSFIKSSAPTTNILLAGGGDIAQNTAFNKPFGITSGTVVEGGTLGSNAYSSTPYLPLSGGNVSGNVGIGTNTPNRKLEVADIDSQFSMKGTITGAPVYQSWYNSSNVRRGFFGFASESNNDIRLTNEEVGNIYISPNNGSTIVSSTVTASPATASNHLVTKAQLDAVANTTGTVTSGSYTPTLSDLANISNSRFDSAIYTKIGNVVTARVSLFITATTPSATAILDFLLPVPRVSTNVTGIGLGSSFEASTVVNTNDNTTTARLAYQPLVPYEHQVIVMFQYLVN